MGRSAMPYRDYVATHILKPLTMTSTTLEPRDVPPERLAHGYRWEDEMWKEEPQLADGSFGAMGGMLTSIRDLSRYVGALMAAWPAHDGAEQGPISRASLREMQQVWRYSPASVARNAADDTLQLRAGGYGYGLGVSQSCAFRHIVAHSGGLPGFGSIMRWLPEHGVGIIAFGNLTYTGWGNVTIAAFDALDRTGALQARVPQPSAAMIQTRDTVSRLIMKWDDTLAERIAAENLYLDRSKDRRQREIETLKSELGACTPGDELEVENALRGRWTLDCERGKLDVTVTLAPTTPPRVQFLSVTPAAQRPAPSACGR
ncbi:MAG: serine hydrolase [Acidobacteria bacterium]|nr:serine hydrolase [Acidobacteriota bacterium]